MTLSEYEKLAMQFASHTDCNPSQSGLLMAAIGLVGESGEFSEIVKKHVFQGHPFNKEKATNELGDVLWNLIFACKAVGVSIEDVMERNIGKLEHRYPNNRFTVDDSINRIDNMKG